MKKILESLKSIDKQIQVLSHAGAVLGWDQETYMPSEAIGERGEQISVIESLVHEKQTSSELTGLFDKVGVTDGSYLANNDLSDVDKAYLRQFYRKYSNSVKIPQDLVVEFSKTASLAQSVWMKARKASKFSDFAPFLEKLLDLSRKKADCLGYESDPYDPLIDEFEPGMTAAKVDTLFTQLESGLIPLVKKIKEAGNSEMSFLKKDYDVTKQEEFSRFVLNKLHFPPDRGRFDISTHPFTTTLGPNDIRITTRYAADMFQTSIFGTIHECGHALYELGFNPDFSGTCLSQCASLGVHESQSRTWENMVGKSFPFWEYFYPVLQAYFTDNLGDVSLNDFYKGVNTVEPSFIRIDADEVTYSLHIILRFKLEHQLINGKLNVKDLPEAWNSLMKQYFGIVPGNDAEGVLQDIHWAFGGFGYFPTYALGNMYGAQFYSKMQEDLPSMEDDIQKGDFSVILQWLRTNIHQYGCVHSADQLCENVCGNSLDANMFLNYLNGKYSKIYEL